MGSTRIVPKRVVVVCKPITAATAASVVTHAHRIIAARRTLAQDEHAATVAGIRAALRGLPIELDLGETAERARIAGADLVISVGGDGTFLTAARAVDDEPMLGVNSSPSTSTGHYCAATLASVREHVDAILHGDSRPRPLVRIAAAIDGVGLPLLALNDALFANTSPVASTRYALEVAGETELQLSSGLWIATTSGSTAAIRSAGGEVMRADDRRLQYLVREPCPDASGGPRRVRGFVETIAIVSRSDQNAIYLDGQPEAYAVRLGATVELSVAARPLRAHGYPTDAV